MATMNFRERSPELLCLSMARSQGGRVYASPGRISETAWCANYAHSSPGWVQNDGILHLILVGEISQVSRTEHLRRLRYRLSEMEDTAVES